MSDSLYSDICEKFPVLAEKANKEYMRRFGELESVMEFQWYVDLAEAINIEMKKGVEPEIFSDIFEFFRTRYINGDNEIRYWVDVSIVENLFWKVPPEMAKPYWDVFPNELKELYIDFHYDPPA